MKRDFYFKVCFGEGRYANGEYAVCAENKDEATEIALSEICNKLNAVLPDLDIEVSVELVDTKNHILASIEDCFINCSKLDDCYGIQVDDAHKLFVLVQEDPDYNDGTLEYLIELNDNSSGSDEPCAKFNASCVIDDLDKFKKTIIEYLDCNGIVIN